MLVLLKFWKLSSLRCSLLALCTKHFFRPEQAVFGGTLRCAAKAGAGVYRNFVLRGRAGFISSFTVAALTTVP